MVHTAATRPLARRLALVVSTGLIASVLTALGHGVARADTAPPSGTPATVSADALPTVQIDGVVWAQVVVGNTVYVTGSFTKARPAGSPAGSNEVARSNLLAYDITTGNLITSFNHTLDAQGLAIAKSPDGSRVYVGGSFTKVDGATHNRIVAIDTASGAIDNSFTAGVDATVQAVTATNSTVYAGGVFSSANGNSRSHVAAFSSSGALLSWNPGANATVTALAMSPDNSRVMVAGRFTTLAGASRYGLGPVDASSGAAVSWPSNFAVRDAGNNSAIYSLVADANQMYATGYVFGSGGNFEGRVAFNPYNGTITMLDDCHGDSYSSWPMSGVLYSVSHSHNCSTIGAFPETNPRTHHPALADTIAATGTVAKNTQSGYANFQGQPAPTQLDWYPTLAIGSYTGQSQAAWSVTGNGTYLSLGGEFPSVNNGQQQGLVRFAVRSSAPNREGPRSSSGTVPMVSASAPNTVAVSWQTTWDYDNGSLTYRLYRDNAASPLDTRTVESRFWLLSTQSYTDSGVTAGTHTYKISVTDPLGNLYYSGVSSPVTVTGGGNQAPAASSTVNCTFLQCAADGTASSDQDGSIQSYAWDFGDGGTATGANASHTYATGGSYSVTLTVTDNQGARGTTVRSVSVAPRTAGGQVVAADSFNRTVTGGWGAADIGGAWTPIGAASALSVVPGQGRITSGAAGASAGVYLATPAAGSDLTLTLTPDRIASGGGMYVYVSGRRVGANVEYRATLKIGADGSVTLSFSKLDGSSTEVGIGSRIVVAGLKLVAGTPLNVRLVTSGSGTTTMQTKVWTGSTEPTSFQNSTTDSSPNLQSAGGVAVRTYLSGSAGNAPVTVAVSALRSATVA